MRSYFLTGTLLLFTVFIYAQEVIRLDNKSSDCSGAIDITGLKEVRATAPIGPGRYNEIQSSNKRQYTFKKEHHTVWYKFYVNQECSLSFVITPDNPKDDYDFVLFMGEEVETCRRIRKGELSPIRSNISRPAPGSKGVTGLGPAGNTDYVHEGKGNNWSKPVVLSPGIVYYLVLDNVYDKGSGHRIQLFYNSCQGPVLEQTEPLSVSFNVMQDQTRRLIPAHLVLVDQSKGYPDYDTVYNAKITSMSIPVKPGVMYAYEISAKSYLKKTGFFKLDSFPDNPVKTIDVVLKSVRLGGSFELENLYFEGGRATLIRKSYPALRELLAIMKDNPDLKIEIQGHVNRQDKRGQKYTEEYYNQLSIDRAKAVYDYLKKRGIDESRMKYTGFGYSQMIYPDATTQEQMQKNRRVVIKIISL